MKGNGPNDQSRVGRGKGQRDRSANLFRVSSQEKGRNALVHDKYTRPADPAMMASFRLGPIAETTPFEAFFWERWDSFQPALRGRVGHGARSFDEFGLGLKIG
jgi:hypothetical protein